MRNRESEKAFGLLLQARGLIGAIAPPARADCFFEAGERSNRNNCTSTGAAAVAAIAKALGYLKACSYTRDGLQKGWDPVGGWVWA